MCVKLVIYWSYSKVLFKRRKLALGRMADSDRYSEAVTADLIG